MPALLLDVNMGLHHVCRHQNIHAWWGHNHYLVCTPDFVFFSIMICFKFIKIKCQLNYVKKHNFVKKFLPDEL